MVRNGSFHMTDNVTSHNQSGGITAKNVNVGATPPFAAEPPRRSSRWKTVAAIVGTLAAIATILTFLGIGPLR